MDAKQMGVELAAKSTFQSTRPWWTRKLQADATDKASVSIHAPVMDANCAELWFGGYCAFQSTRPWWTRTIKLAPKPPNPLFQSTRPWWTRSHGCRKQSDKMVSIHAPVMDANYHEQGCYPFWQVSIHAPVMDAKRKAKQALKPAPVSIHAPVMDAK